MAWRPAKSLLKLREQINALAPKRSKLSDGTLGNLEHSARTSDHNPDANGVVKAMDITHDPAHGVDTYALAELLRQKRDKRIKYCLVPETRVLRADLRWVPIGDVAVGDRLVAFDEYGEWKPWHKNRPNKVCTAGQKMRTATVEAAEVIKRPAYELVTDKATVISSEDHLWLTAANRYHGKYRQWVETKELEVGKPLQHFAEPWAEEKTFDAGWLVGLFEGEGCLSLLKENGAWSLSVSQREGVVLDRAMFLLDEFGVNYEVYDNGPVQSIVIRGGLPYVLSFLGRFRSYRLTDRAINEAVWHNKMLAGGWGDALIQEVRPVGVKEVVSVQTTTRTFLAEGLFSHNCISNGRIWNSEQSPFKWRKYNGSNRHDHHVHVSVKAAKAFYDDATAWDITLNPPKGKVVAERPVLKKGATGKDVADLQKLLEIPVTKTFDKATDDAVREFQKQSGLTVDGIVGPYTWQELE